MAVKDTDWGEFDALLAETCIVAVKDPDTAASGWNVTVSLHELEGAMLFPAQSDETVKTVWSDDWPGMDSPVITMDFGSRSHAPGGSVAVISTVLGVDDPAAWLPKSNEDGFRVICGVAG